ncbi:MAG: hypothetical protein DHS20C21_03660 [Gemmatimonadota bacterium]|nr:MAG: hypothetical protein DHS20C21_03660 [Gemmatimonadota bacterium]
MSPVHPDLQAAFAALTRANVRWCLLRGRDALSAPEGDVDLVVHPEDRRAARSALESAGFVMLRSWAGGSQNFYLQYARGSDSWIYLHVVTMLDFGPFHSLRLRPGVAGLLRRTVDDAGVPVPAPDDRFWVTLLHALLDKGRVATKHQGVLQELEPSATPDGELARALDELGLPHGSAATLRSAVRSRDWGSLNECARDLQAAWRKNDRASRRRERSHRASLTLTKLREIVTRRGVAAALLAPDGAGKSTVIASLRDSLFFTVRTYYLGLEGGAFAGQGRSRIPGLGMARRLGHAWRTWLRSRIDLSRRRWVLFDRYPYEALLPTDPPLRTLSRWRRALLAHALPAPDLVVVLDAPGAILHGRKQEHSVERLERDRAGYRSLADARRHWVLVDASNPIDDVRRDVTEAMWQRYRARFVKD